MGPVWWPPYCLRRRYRKRSLLALRIARSASRTVAIGPFPHPGQCPTAPLPESILPVSCAWTPARQVLFFLWCATMPATPTSWRSRPTQLGTLTTTTAGGGFFLGRATPPPKIDTNRQDGRGAGG